MISSILSQVPSSLYKCYNVLFVVCVDLISVIADPLAPGLSHQPTTSSSQHSPYLLILHSSTFYLFYHAVFFFSFVLFVPNKNPSN